jgi:hypothetical protein
MGYDLYQGSSDIRVGVGRLSDFIDSLDLGCYQSSLGKKEGLAGQD